MYLRETLFPALLNYLPMLSGSFPLKELFYNVTLSAFFIFEVDWKENRLNSSKAKRRNLISFFSILNFLHAMLLRSSREKMTARQTLIPQ